MNYNNLKFIIAGPGKTGTFWLAQCLREHREVFVTTETNYLTHYDQMPLENWEKYFEHRAHKTCLGEYANWYFSWDGIPERLASENSELKIIVCVRDPVCRAISFYLHDRRWGTLGNHVKLSFAIKEDMFFHRYIESGLYSRHLKKYLKYFPPEQIFLFNTPRSNDVISKKLNELFGFLGVEKAEVPSANKSLNVTIMPFWPSLHRATVFGKRPLLVRFARLLDPLNCFLGRRYRGNLVDDGDLTAVRRVFSAFDEKRSFQDLLENVNFSGDASVEDWS